MVEALTSKGYTHRHPHWTEVMALLTLGVVPTLLLFLNISGELRLLEQVCTELVCMGPIYMTKVCGLWSPGDRWPIPFNDTSPWTARDGLWVKWWEQAQTRFCPLPLIQSYRMSTSYWQDQIWSLRCPYRTDSSDSGQIHKECEDVFIGGGFLGKWRPLVTIDGSHSSRLYTSYLL